MLSKLAYHGLVYPISKLPLSVIYFLSDILYWVFRLVPYRKKVIIQNLKNSFPEKSNQEINQLCIAFYHHFTDILAEGVKNLSISREELMKRYKVKNPELMENFYKQGKSVVLVSGHYNNWEWLISAQNFLFPHQAIGIGMPLSSKFWDQKINERRQRFGMKVVHAKNFKEVIEKRNDKPVAILTLSDQSPGDATKSYWMSFLNQPTAVLFGAEMMAHQYDFPVVFYHTRKIKRGYYEMELESICEDPKQSQWGEITELHTRQLEVVIIEKPEFWLWSHKRWKRKLPQNLELLKHQQKKKFEQRFKINT